MKLNKILNKTVCISVLSTSVICAMPAFSAETGMKNNELQKEGLSIRYERANPASILETKEFKINNSLTPSTTIFGLPQNMGPIDRVLRGVVAAGLIGTGAYGLSTGNLNTTLSYSLIGVSVIPIATASTGYCPLYQLFGLEYSF